MGTVKQSQVTPIVIGDRRTRYLAHTDQLMMAVIDFDDGPTAEPDPPHAHPHEQVSYVAAGEIIFYLDGVATHLGSGDLFTVPSGVPHAIQLLSVHARIVDAFHPLRDEFLADHPSVEPKKT